MDNDDEIYEFVMIYEIDVLQIQLFFINYCKNKLLHY